MNAAVFPGALRRLRAMDAAEMKFRVAGILRNTVERARVRVAATTWDRSDLRLEGPGLGQARERLADKDWHGAHLALAHHFATRRPVFPLSAALAADRAREIRVRFPDADATLRADRVMSGSYDLLGYHDVAVGSPPDWHTDAVHRRSAPLIFWETVPYLDPACGDHKVTWELNRHQHFLLLGRAFQLTGNRKYYDEFVRQLGSWIDANPPLIGTNWASMLELAFRSLSWIWSLECFAAAAAPDDQRPWIVDLLLALDRQLLHIEHNLSRYFSPNTHLTGEALALYVAGLALPELPHASRRLAVGRGVLLEEASVQVNADGGHAELSAHYHRYSTDFYLLALNLARLNGDGAATALGAAARAQAGYLRTIADDRGLLPSIGDDDGGLLFPICRRSPLDCSDTLAHAAVLLDDDRLLVGPVPEETWWFCANVAPDSLARTPGPRPASATLPVSGFCISRNDRGDHLIFDCGAHGFLNGGHAHADALSVVVTAAGRPLLVDSGTFTYTMDPEARDRFRASAMHNTVIVDGLSQSESSGPFHWRTRADARCTGWRSEADHDYAAGEHDGYAPRRHTRRILSVHGIGWFVRDEIGGGPTGTQAAAMWHLHPAWTVELRDSHVAELRHEDGTRLGMATTAVLEPVTGPQALYSPVYGKAVSAPTLAAAATGSRIVMTTFIAAADQWRPHGVGSDAAGRVVFKTAGGSVAISHDEKIGLASSVHPT